MLSRLRAPLICAFLVTSSVALLSSSASAEPTTVSYTGPPVAIPDGSDLTGSAPGAPVSASVTASGHDEYVHKVVLRIDGYDCSDVIDSTTVGLSLSFVGDLRLTLTAPNGHSVEVVRRSGGGGNNFCQTVLDDNAEKSIAIVYPHEAPFTGTFSPYHPLSAFRGTPANGTWTLTAQDFYSQDTGHIRAFSVLI